MPERDFESIYTDYSRLVYWAAYKVVSNREAAEDITQSVFEKLLEKPEMPEDMNDQQLKGWLYRVTTNLALDKLRKAKHELLSDEPVGAEIPDSSKLPEDRLLEKKRLDAVRQAIAALDEVYREVIMLHYFSEMTVKEISRSTGISEGTIKSRLVRARTLLADKLKQSGFGGVLPEELK